MPELLYCRAERKAGKLDKTNSHKIKVLAEDKVRKPRIVLIGQIDELTGFDPTGDDDDGAKYAYRFRDLSRGASE